MTIVGTLPVTLQNGTTADATDVMADLNKIKTDVNANAAENGANSDITSLSGLTTPLSVAQGGTGSTSSPYVDYQVFTTDGTWTKPTGVRAGSMVHVEAWAPGGGGGSSVSGGGGGGGAYVDAWFLASDLGSTETVTVPAGGAVNTQGADATFGSALTAYGGGAGYSDTNGGGGGGQTSRGASGTIGAGGVGGGPANAAAGAFGISGGGGGTSTNGGNGYYGGGGGGALTLAGGSSVYGGGGGGDSAGGASKFGGAGGAAGVAGTAPGGGGGQNAAGARAEIRVTTFI